MRRDDGQDSHRQDVWFMAALELRDNYQGSSRDRGFSRGKNLGSNDQPYSKRLEDQ